MSELFAFEVRDPASLMRDIADRVPLVAGRALVALVRSVSTAQEVVRVDRLRLPAEIFDRDEAGEELRRAMQAWALPWGSGRPSHSSVLVVVRPGLCVIGPNESMWLIADCAADRPANLWSAPQLFVVTEHGWLHTSTKEAGHQPAMALAD